MTTDPEFEEMLEDAKHEKYMRALLEILDDPDVEPPILIFPQGYGVEIISTDEIEYAQLVGYLSAATLQVQLEWLEAGYEE